MDGCELIGSIVRLRKFAPVVDLQWAESLRDEGSLNLIDNYIVTSELAEHFEKVLEGFTLKRHGKKALREGGILDASTHPRAHILRGQYGTGKSYFLLMMSALLESLGNEELFNELYNKFRIFEGIRFHMDNLRQSGSKYLVVRIDGVKNIDMRFHELVQKSVISRMEKVLGGHDFSDSYAIALRKLEEYRLDPVFSRLLDNALEKSSLAYDSLVDGLKASKRQSLNKYKDIMETITRHKIDEGFDSLEAFLRSASSYVKGKGYTGIAIVFDEFSAYAGASIEEKRITADLAAIQSLAQLTVPREGLDLFFICSMHVDIGLILGEVMTVAEEIQKVRGRFSEMTLSFKNSANLVENILMVDSGKFKALRDKYRKYFGALPVHYPDMEKVYPIHPQTVDSIISVSSRFAQSERTIFSFFAEAVNRKLGEPVIKDERLNLITTGEIYDYFIDTISERNIQLKNSALRCLSFSKNDMERDTIKALVIAYISAGEKSDTRLSSKNIAFIIGVDNILQIDLFLKELSANPASNIVFYEKENRFEFIAAGNAAEDLKLRLDKDSERIDSYEALIGVLEEYASAVCIRKSYIVNPSRDVLPVRKDISGVIYRPADLLKSIEREISGIEKDGKLIFVIPGFGDVIPEDFARTLGEKLSNAPANICVAIPKSFPAHMERDLKTYAAARNMQKSGKLDENDSKTLHKMLQPLEKTVDYEIRKFGSTASFTFLFGGGTVVDGFSNLEELYKFMLLKHYNKFPKVESGVIRGKNSVHMLVENFLVFGEKTNIPENYSSELDRLIMDVLRPLDLVKVDRSGSGYSARLKVPEKENNRESFEIWNIINDVSRPVKEVFSLLGSAPYGLPDYMTELYIASAVAANKLAITYRGQAMQLNKMSIALINTAGYALEKVKTASHDLKAEVKKVWSMFSKIHMSCGAAQFEPGMARSDADVHSMIASDMADVRVMLEGFEARLEKAGVKNRMLLDMMEALFSLRAVKNPAEYMERFAVLPFKVCGIGERDAAFKRFDEFLEFLAGLNTYLESIRRMDTGLDAIRNLEGTENEYSGLKTLYYEVSGGFDRLKKDMAENVFSPEILKELEGKLHKLISGYNRAFIGLHEEVGEGVRKLLALLDSPAIRLIEAFESISFKNIKRISDMRFELQRMKPCGIKHAHKGNEPLSCSCTGFQAGLAGLAEQAGLVQNMKKSFEKQIENIGGNHVSRLLAMDEKTDGESGMTLSDYLKGIGEAADGANGRSAAIEEWDKLKDCLKMGFAAITDECGEEVINLTTGLARHINAYLAQSDEARKLKEAETKARRKIGFRKLYAQIQSEIANSGYRSVTVEDFAKALQRIIDKVRKEYDEVEIEE